MRIDKQNEEIKTKVQNRKGQEKKDWSQPTEEMDVS
jgi:hypothetical protein